MATACLFPPIIPPASFGSSSFDCLALPPDHPQPLRRLSLRDISITITLAGVWALMIALWRVCCNRLSVGPLAWHS